MLKADVKCKTNLKAYIFYISLIDMPFPLIYKILQDFSLHFVSYQLIIRLANQRKELQAVALFNPIVGDNIKRLMKATNMKNNVLAPKVGISKTHLSDIKNAKKGASLEVLDNIARELGVTTADLFFEPKENKVEHISIEEARDTIIKVPLIGDVPTSGKLLSKENIIDYIPFSSIMIQGFDNPFCLKVNGKTMSDVGLNDGDLIIANYQSHAENGQTVIVRINGEVTCKRFYWLSRPCTCRLEPTNNNTPVDIGDIEIIGVVVKSFKTFSDV